MPGFRRFLLAPKNISGIMSHSSNWHFWSFVTVCVFRMPPVCQYICNVVDTAGEMQSVHLRSV